MSSRFPHDGSPASLPAKSSCTSSVKSLEYKKSTPRSLNIILDHLDCSHLPKSDNFVPRQKASPKLSQKDTNGSWSETQVVKYKKNSSPNPQQRRSKIIDLNSPNQISKSKEQEKTSEERVNSTQETLHQVREKLEDLHKVLRIYSSPETKTKPNVEKNPEVRSGTELAGSILQDLKNIANLPPATDSDSKTPSSHPLETNTEESASDFEPPQTHENSSTTSPPSYINSVYSDHPQTDSNEYFTSQSREEKNEPETCNESDPKTSNQPISCNESPKKIPPNFLPSPTSSQSFEHSKESDSDDRSNATLLREALQFKKALITHIELDSDENRTESSCESDEASWPKSKSYFHPKLLDIISEEQSASSSTEKPNKIAAPPELTSETINENSEAEDKSAQPIVLQETTNGTVGQSGVDLRDWRCRSCATQRNLTARPPDGTTGHSAPPMGHSGGASEESDRVVGYFDLPVGSVDGALGHVCGTSGKNVCGLKTSRSRSYVTLRKPTMVQVCGTSGHSVPPVGHSDGASEESDGAVGYGDLPVGGDGALGCASGTLGQNVCGLKTSRSRSYVTLRKPAMGQGCGTVGHAVPPVGYSDGASGESDTSEGHCDLPVEHDCGTLGQVGSAVGQKVCGLNASRSRAYAMLRHLAMGQDDGTSEDTDGTQPQQEQKMAQKSQEISTPSTTRKDLDKTHPELIHETINENEYEDKSTQPIFMHETETENSGVTVDFEESRINISDLMNQSVQNIRDYIEVFSQMQNDGIVETRKATVEEKAPEIFVKETWSNDSMTRFVNVVALVDSVSEELPRKLSEPAIISLMDLESSEDSSQGVSDFAQDFSLKRRPGTISLAEAASGTKNDLSNETCSLFESAHSEIGEAGEILSSEPSCKELVMDYSREESQNDLTDDGLNNNIDLIEFDEEKERKEDDDVRGKAVESPLTGRTVIRSSRNCEIDKQFQELAECPNETSIAKSQVSDQKVVENLAEPEKPEISSIRTIGNSDSAISELREISDIRTESKIIQNKVSDKANTISTDTSGTYMDASSREFLNSSGISLAFDRSLLNRQKITTEVMSKSARGSSSSPLAQRIPWNSPKRGSSLGSANSARGKKIQIDKSKESSMKSPKAKVSQISRNGSIKGKRSLNLSGSKDLESMNGTVGRSGGVLKERRSRSYTTPRNLKTGQADETVGLGHGTVGQSNGSVGPPGATLRRADGATGHADEAAGQARGTVGQSTSVAGPAGAMLRHVDGATGHADEAGGQVCGTLGQSTSAAGPAGAILRHADGATGHADGSLGHTDVTQRTTEQRPETSRPSRTRKEWDKSRTDLGKSATGLTLNVSSKSFPTKTSSKSCIPILKTRIENVRQQTRAKSPMRGPLTISTSSWNEDSRRIGENSTAEGSQVEVSGENVPHSRETVPNLRQNVLNLRETVPIPGDTVPAPREAIPTPRTNIPTPGTNVPTPTAICTKLGPAEVYEALDKNRTVIYVNIVTEQEHTTTRVVDPKTFLEYLKDRDLKIQNVLDQDVVGELRNSSEPGTVSSPRILTVISSAVRGGETTSDRTVGSPGKGSWSSRVDQREIEVSAKPSVMDTSTSISDLPEVSSKTSGSVGKFQIFEVPKELTKDEYIVLLEALNEDPNLHQLREMQKLCKKLGLGFRE